MWISNEKQQEGHDLAWGVLVCLVQVWFAGVITLIIIVAAINLFNIGTDDSDASGRNRSGLCVHVDAKTGVEYLSDGNGGLIVRAKEEK